MGGCLPPYAHDWHRGLPPEDIFEQEKWGQGPDWSGLSLWRNGLLPAADALWLAP
jgi:hypothetical protein